MLECLKKEELILNKIKEYENIVIFRHENPDFDALGSQFGIKYLIEENFENKHVYVVGQNIVNDRGNMFDKMDVCKYIGSNYYSYPTNIATKSFIQKDSHQTSRINWWG